MLATYHNHSTWSDGNASVAALVAWAEAHGVGELGISDHFTLRPGGEAAPWSLPPERLGDYADEVLSFRGRTRPVVRLGIEVDWFPGHAEVIRRALHGIPFDYVVGSVHEIGPFIVDGSAAGWDRLDQTAQNEVHRQYWIHMRSLAESRLFEIAAHLDLTKKFGHHATIDLSAEIDAALDAIAAAGTVVELNTAGWHKLCADAYPSLDLLRACHRRSIPVTLSADAHQPDHLLRDFARGADRLRAAGYDEVGRFAARRVTFERLEEAMQDTHST